MNSLQRFEYLAERARGEQAPALDVSWQVMRAIRVSPPQFELHRPLLAAAAGLSLVAASAVLALAVENWLTWSDPLSGFISSVTLVLQ